MKVTVCGVVGVMGDMGYGVWDMVFRGLASVALPHVIMLLQNSVLVTSVPRAFTKMHANMGYSLWAAIDALAIEYTRIRFYEFSRKR